MFTEDSCGDRIHWSIEQTTRLSVERGKALADLRVENRIQGPAYCFWTTRIFDMNDLQCMIQGCQAKVYSPAGTQHVCKEHFLSFLTWRRRKGAQMFVHYAGLSMDQRDPIAAEWSKTVSTVEAPSTTASKP